MQLFEIKNDIAKILYTPSDNHLLLADFLLIEDNNQSLVAQIIDIESTDEANTNIATIKFSLSINKQANLSTYNGYTPSKNANIVYIEPSEIAQLIQSSKANLYWGNLASHPETKINLGFSLLRERPYIQCDKIENATIITTNILYGLQGNKKRTILFDFDGRYRKINNANRIIVSKEYKLPLNFEAFNFIADNDLEDCSTENKAIIHGILLELQSYVETLDEEFIPFDIFKSVIDQQCKQNPIPELIIFKNKLVKYQQKGLFAQDSDQFDFINRILSTNSVTIIDASFVEEKWHRFILETITSQIEKKCYLITNLTETNSNAHTLISLYENDNLRVIPVTSYKYKDIYHLKTLCKNLILFAPIEKTNDFEVYNSFLNKLNQKEFIIWSENTFYMPLIIKLRAFESEIFKDTVSDEIQNEVDKMLTAQAQEISKPEINTLVNAQVLDLEPYQPQEEKNLFSEIEPFEPEADLPEIEEIKETQIPFKTTVIQEETQPFIDDLTEDDLDYLDNLNLDEIANTEPQNEDYTIVEEAETVTLEPTKTQPLPQQPAKPQKPHQEQPTVFDIAALQGQSFDIDEEESEETTTEELSYIPQTQEEEPEINLQEEAELVIEPAKERPPVREQIVQESITKPREIEQPKTVLPQAPTTTQTTKTAVAEKQEEPEITRLPEPPEPKPIPKTPTVPIYEAKIPEVSGKTVFKEGNFVFHAKYGKGIVEKIITYGNKTLCSIQFDNVGRRLLDPNLADIKLV